MDRSDSSAEDGQTRADLLPGPPATVSARFGGPAEQLLVRYAGWLAGEGTVRGLIGPRELPRLWERHLLNSVALAELLPPAIRVVDIGTGAGLPGLAVACVRPDIEVDLVESLQRRTQFLTEVVDDLSFDSRVRVVRGRAEDRDTIDLVGSSPFVTARAVAPLDRLCRWALPLLNVGGELLAMKGRSAEQEIEEHGRAVSRAGGLIRGVRDCGSNWLDEPTRVVIVERKR
jgi:16S rRNA (guanine527-N7)-methyltransferase